MSGDRFPGSGPRYLRAWPNTSLTSAPKSEYDSKERRKNGSRAPLPGLPVRAQPAPALPARSGPSRGLMTPQRGPGQDPVRPGRNQPLTHATRADADHATREDAHVVRPSLWTRRLCGCGHDRGAHRHYRQGSDCALCDCPRWSTRHLICQLARRLWR
jgi:hypothetical protein